MTEHTNIECQDDISLSSFAVPHHIIICGPKGPNMTENAKNTPKMAQKSHFEVWEYLPI